MITQVISIGDKIDLWKTETKDNKENKSIYKSQVVDFIDEDNIRMLMPFDGTKLVPLDVGVKYTLCIYTKKGLYNCRCIIKQRYRQENLIILEAQIVSELEKYQRREYYRLECLIEVEYRKVTDEELALRKQYKNNKFINDDEMNECLDKIKEYETKWLKGTIIDISGGGARLNSNLVHEKNQLIVLKIPFNSGKSLNNMEFNGKIIFSLKIQNRTGFYEHRIQFSNISKEKRETIIKFIFEEERRIRRREKGLE